MNGEHHHELNRAAFLSQFAVLLEQYQATLHYTDDDDGIHIDLRGCEIFVGWLDSDPAAELTKAAQKKTDDYLPLPQPNADLFEETK